MIEELIAPPTRGAIDHQTWAQLYARQLPLLPSHACALFQRGLPDLGLDPQRLPNQQAISARLSTLSGWTLVDAQGAYLTADQWFEHLAERRFPVTNYIRAPEELEFTPLPDLFHEYFGHLAFFTDRRFGNIAQAFGPLYLAANERQRLEIARIWWFTTEFGLIIEDGALRAFGAGLLSSPAELQLAFAPDTPRLAFTIDTVAATASAVYDTHGRYFVFGGVEDLAAILRAYAQREGLPEPAI